ncbi:MAG: hypothetical protein JWM68_3993 [Verrucomicrobiales bacterium]|nr:hypothetical protein [Verrucomicrobiales bacterium]
MANLSTPDGKIAHVKYLFDSPSVASFYSESGLASLLLNHRVIDFSTVHHVLPLARPEIHKYLINFAASAPWTDDEWVRYQIAHIGCYDIPTVPPRKSTVRENRWQEVLAYRQAAEAIRAYCLQQGNEIKPRQAPSIDLPLEVAVYPVPYISLEENRAFNETVATSLLGWRKGVDSNGTGSFWMNGDEKKEWWAANHITTDNRHFDALWTLLLNSHPWKYISKAEDKTRWADVILRQHLEEPYPAEPALVVCRPTSCVTVLRKKSSEFPWHTEPNEYGEPIFSYDGLIQAIENGENFSIPGHGHADAVCRALLVARIQQQREPERWVLRPNVFDFCGTW